MNLLFVCTGNAARSVMAAAMARCRFDAHEIRSAGTLSLEGRPMSERTRTALEEWGIEDRDHRSRQLAEPDLKWADVVVVFEPSHLLYIRRHHPDAAAKSVAFPRLVQLLMAAPPTNSVKEVMEASDLATIDADPIDEVIDPAGGNQDDFDQAAKTISALIDELGEQINRRAPDGVRPQ